LVKEGLDHDRVVRFFKSGDLNYNPAPMESKLRELFGIFFNSDLTKAVQEKLFQLGYDIRIDGRNGPGTKSMVSLFEKEHKYPVLGKVTETLSSRLDAALKTERKKSLKEYSPPPAQKPDRSSTHKNFTSPAAIKTIKAHYQSDKKLFDRMEVAFGVPGPLVASIMWIETSYGGYLGKNKAAIMLASMAASKDYKVIEPYVRDLEEDRGAKAYLSETSGKRGLWAQDELKALLVYAWENGLEPLSFPGSIYGAIGYGQFMPSNVKKYAVDGNGDGKIDLFDKADAIFSIGNYLKNHGWAGDMKSEEKRREVIRRYNNSGVYVNTVLFVMEAIRKG
jgi:membrane-bound lytic murein transglycosylase B